jgi:hypothetical protein
MSQSDKITSIIGNLQNTIKELETLKTDTAPVTINIDSTPPKETKPSSCQPISCQ